MKLAFERMYDDRDEWAVYVITDDGKRCRTDVIVAGADPNAIGDEDCIRYRSFADRGVGTRREIHDRLRPVVPDDNAAMDAAFGRKP